MGIDTQAYDFRYAPDFFEGMEPQEVRAELSKARDAANQISSRMAKVFEQNRMGQRQQEQAGQRQEGEQNRENGPKREKTPEPDAYAGPGTRTATRKLAAPGGGTGTIGRRCED